MKTIAGSVLVWLALIGSAAMPLLAAEQARRDGTRDVTFIATSDCHYVAADSKNNRNQLNLASIEQMNIIANVAWPAGLGGDLIKRPRGVVVMGDCIDDGDRRSNGRNVSEEQFKFFVKDFGLDATDGRLHYPVFEGWGNHDGPPIGKEKSGFSFQGNLKKRNQLRKAKGLISNVSENGLHYSWDWDDVHCAQLNIYPADRQRDGIRYSPVWHDPQGSLSFLKKDLAEQVGTSGRPVVLMAHCGFDTDWWAPDDWRALYDAARDYNVILYIYGHSGTGLHEWASAGETGRWTCVNDGQTENGFFVIQIVADRVRLAYRCKEAVTTIRNADGSIHRDWSGQWSWRWPMEKKIPAPARAQQVKS
jgi:cytolysin (calcineurin-like family phosphatase)